MSTRYIIVHRSNAEWETGNVKPDPKLIGKVGKMIADMQKENIMRDGDGLGPSSKGVRLSFTGGDVHVTKGPLPLTGNNDPAGFATINVLSLDDAISHAKRLAQDLGGDVEIDIRPVNEAWDIGVAEKPADLKTTRYMLLDKRSHQAKHAPKDVSGSIKSMTDAGVLQKSERMTDKGTRIRRSSGGFQLRDGPFAESKELVGGYVILETPKENAIKWAQIYMECVDVPEVDVIELR